MSETPADDGRNKKAEDAHIAAVNAEGKKIYMDYCERIKDTKFAALDHQAKYDYYMKMYPDFARGNPIILRHIASWGLFNELANFLYYKKCYMNPIQTNEDYCDRQADFVQYLYKYTDRSLTQDQLNAIWRKTKKGLMKEIAENAREKEEIRRKREQFRVDADIKRRYNIRQLVARLRASEPNELPADKEMPQGCSSPTPQNYPLPENFASPVPLSRSLAQPILSSVASPINEQLQPLEPPQLELPPVNEAALPAESEAALPPIREAAIHLQSD